MSTLYILIIIPPLYRNGVYCFTSVRPSVRSKIFFVAFFSATIDGRNLIFGHKLHIVIPYMRSVFGPVRFLLPVCRLSWFLCTLNIYMYAGVSQVSIRVVSKSGIPGTVPKTRAQIRIFFITSLLRH